MAGFLDTPVQFNGYVQQNPVEAMAAVGIQREQQFQEGIAKVQQYRDNLLALPISKDVTQQYLKQKIGQFDSAIQQSIQGDYSDQRLINQIGGIAGKITADPIIQNGILSTAAIQSGYAQAQAAKKSPKDGNGSRWAQQNDEYFQDQVNKWQFDGDLQSSFTGHYTEYVDYMDRFTKAYKEAHPGENLNAQDIYLKGEDGNYLKDKDGKYVISPTVRDGVDANKINSIWNLVNSQPDVQEQLGIDGWARYRGATPTQLWQSQKANVGSFINTAQATIRDLQVKMATDKTVNAADYTKQINALKEQVQGQKDNFDGFSSLLQQNPAAAKSQLIQNETLHNLIGAYSYQTMKKSPLWEANMESAKYELDLTKFQLEQEKFKYQQKHDTDVLNADLQKALISASGKKKNADGTDAGGVYSTITNVPEALGKLNDKTFDDLHNAKREQVNQGTYGAVFDMYNASAHDGRDFNPIRKDAATGELRFNVDPTGTTGYTSMEAAHNAYRKAYADGREAVNAGRANPATMRSYDALDAPLRDLKAMDAKAAELNTEKSAIVREVGRTTGVSNTDYIDAYAVDHKLVGAFQSESRLKAKYGQDWRSGLGIDDQPYIPNSSSPYEVAPNISGFDKNLKEYTSFSKKFDQNLAPRFQELQNKYRDAQQQNYPIQSSIISNEPKEKEDVRQKFITEANARTSGDATIAKSAEDFQSVLSDSKEKFKDNIYGARFDPSTNQYFLTVQRDATSKPAELPVDRATFEKFPGLIAQNDFQNKFGSTLALSGGVTTDIPGSTPFVMKRAYDSKYDVRYHVFQNSSGGWDVKLAIKDAKTGNDITGMQPTGLSTSKTGIMSFLQTLQQSDQYVESYIPADILLQMKQPNAQQPNR